MRFLTFTKFLRERSIWVMTPVISTANLVKTFGPTRALDGLDLSVAAGDVHCFLGAN